MLFRSSDVAAIYANTSGLAGMLYTRRIEDEIYYGKTKQLLGEYQSVRVFSNMGMTANNLVQNFVGTDKLKERINP